MSTSHAAIPAGQPVPEPGVEPDGIDTPTLLMWGFVSVAITLGVMFAASALYFATQRQLNAERVIAPPYVDSDKVVTDQLGVLSSYAAPAGAGKPYAIPVERAKQLVLAELQSKKSE